jgi:uncharacterized phage protein (TIGR02218 family)
MKTASTALQNHLAQNNQFFFADLYTFTLLDGTIVRMTSWESNIVSAGQTFLASGPFVERTKVRTVLGLEVDKVEIKISAGIVHTINGMPWLIALQQGKFDGATVSVDRLIMPAPGDASLGTFNLFTGTVAEIEIGVVDARITVRSLLELLNVQMPRHLIQSPCHHMLFDAGCGLVKNNFATLVNAQLGSTPIKIITFALAQPTGHFDLGTATGVSGANAGLSRTIRSYTNPNVILLNNSFPNAIAAGDQFNLYPGCDKTQATCQGKFNNLANFGGMPYVPAPETAI